MTPNNKGKYLSFTIDQKQIFTERIQFNPNSQTAILDKEKRYLFGYYIVMFEQFDETELPSKGSNHNIFNSKHASQEDK